MSGYEKVRASTTIFSLSPSTVKPHITRNARVVGINEEGDK
jgi:hypothetical protein